MASAPDDAIWLLTRYPSVTELSLSWTSNPYRPLSLMKLFSNRLFTLVLLIALPFAAVLVSTIPDPPQFLTSTAWTSTCQFRVMIPSVLPEPLHSTVRFLMASGCPVVEELSRYEDEASTYPMSPSCLSTVPVRLAPT